MRAPALLVLAALVACSYSSSRVVPASLQERLRRGLLGSGELNRALGPSARDLEAFSRVKFEGSVGVILSLEGVLADLRDAFKYAYAVLAEDLREPVPADAQILDVVGIPFNEALTALQWAVPRESAEAVEARFCVVLTKIMDALPVRSFGGANELLGSLIQAGNEVSINTYLPRDLAIKALSRSGLSDTLEGRVGGERLVFPSAEFAVTKRGQQLLRCCVVMGKPPTLTVSVDSNYRNILDGKRDGLTCIGIKGMSPNAYQLRSADKLFDKLASVRPKDVYQLVERAVRQEEGPEQQTAPAASPDGARLKSVAAPAQFEDERPRDTFADETGSDTM